jgi:hypothetical protein
MKFATSIADVPRLEADAELRGQLEACVVVPA